MTSAALIAHVIDRLDFGGLENGLVNLVNGLPQDRFDHLIICLSGYSEFRRRIRRIDLPVLSLEKQPGKDPGSYLKLWRILRERRPDVLHTRNVGTVDMQWVGWAAGVPRRVHGEHGWTADDAEGRDPRRLAIRRACRPVVHRWMAMSQDIARWIERDVRVPSTSIRQVYSGVDARCFAPIGPGVPDLPWPADRDSVTIGTVGRLDPVKNQQALLAATHSILERHPELRGRLRLIIAGDGPLRSDLQQAAERLAPGVSVWMAGARSDVPELMRSLDVFVLPSLNEGISNTILEAMACGRPVVAARVGGNAELVEHGRTGLLYEPGDPQALPEALLHYLDAPELRDRHGREARSRVKERFSLEAMIQRYADFYDDLLERRH